MFFAGHGVSTDNKNLKYNPHINKYLTDSGVILPYEFDANNIANTIIIGKRDLRPYLIEIDKYVNKSLIIVDACYAGKSIKGKLRVKKTPFVKSNSKDYPYNNILYIASSTPRKEAKSGVLSKALNNCPIEENNIDRFKLCMNKELRYKSQVVVVINK